MEGGTKRLVGRRGDRSERSRDVVGNVTTKRIDFSGKEEKRKHGGEKKRGEPTTPSVGCCWNLKEDVEGGRREWRENDCPKNKHIKSVENVTRQAGGKWPTRTSGSSPRK